MAVLEESKAESTISPLEWLAIKLVGKNADNFREAIPVGPKHAVDILLRIQGTISVGEDGTATVQEKPKLDNLLGHIIKRLTPTDWESIKQSVLEAAQANGGTLPGVEEGYAAKADGLVKLLSKSKTQNRKGMTKGSFRVGQVDESQLSPTVQSSVKRLTRQIILEDVE